MAHTMMMCLSTRLSKSIWNVADLQGLCQSARIWGPLSTRPLAGWVLSASASFETGPLLPTAHFEAPNGSGGAHTEHYPCLCTPSSACE
jgi:hypothetical protein